MQKEFKPKIASVRWTPDRELKLLKKWDEERLYEFEFSPDDPRDIIAIDTPPPYPSGKWHVGGAAHYAQIDMIARYFRLKGYNVLVPFYADRNGLPVEVQVEKAYNVNPHDLSKTKEGRLKFLELCKGFLDKVESELVSIWKRLGCSFQYWKEGTDSEEYRKLTQATFIDLYKRGLIYQAERPVNWCPRCKTTLADAELEYEQKKDYLYYIKFRVKETGEYVVVATTRPELLKSCKALAFNPRDERYTRLLGLHAINPLYGHEMPILVHDSIDPEFGTGLVMVCSYGDHSDVVMFRDLRLEPEILVDRSGVLTESAGPLAGLSITEARKRAVELLKAEGALVKEVEVLHEVPVCWRCKTPIQIIHAKEWFLKQLEFKDELLSIINRMEFKPEFHKVKLISWLNSIATDWPISRDRYYGTEIPVWICEKCGKALIPEPGRYYRPWLEPAPWEHCPHCGASREYLKGETKVFDTWFDSSITVLYITGYARNPKLFEKTFKNALRPQGQDIIRTWLYYSILRVYQLLGEPAFRWIRITGMGLDEKGEAMHKSKGNVIDPEPFLEKYGADAFRYWAAASAKLGYDYRFSEAMIRTGLLFATKLWNIARYISSFPEPQEYKLRPIDRATLALCNKLVVEVDKGYNELDVFEPINQIYQFTWNYFASHYIELTKSRAYNTSYKYDELEQKGVWYTLHYVLKRILVMLSPIMPFVTDAIYREMYGRTVHRERFPEPDEQYLREPYDLALKVQGINHAIWKYKKANNIAFRAPLRKKVYIPIDFKPVKEELVDLHVLEAVEFYIDRPPENVINIGEGVYIEP